MDPLLPSSDQDRRLESERIEREYAEHLAPRNGATEHKYSADFLASRPRSALEALKITPEQQELVIYHYASTSSIPKTAALSGLGVDKVRAIIFNPTSSERIDDYRAKMRVSIIGKIEQTQVSLLEAMQDEIKLRNASLREISGVFSEVTAAQVSLVTATREAAGPAELSVDPSEIFSGEDMEYMALLRRRLDFPASGKSSAREAGDPMSGHDLIDVDFTPHKIDPGYDPIPDVRSREYDPFAEQNEGLDSENSEKIEDFKEKGD